MGFDALKRGCCWCGIHQWSDNLKDFSYCLWCGKVIWFTGKWYWDLDICNTEKRYDTEDVWP